MIPRKKRIAIITTIIIILLVGIASCFGYLYFLTDIFKTKEQLFTKYFGENLQLISYFISQDFNKQINQDLKMNKYESQLLAKIDYIENVNTTSENKNNPINNLYLTMNSQVDETNNYVYKNIKIINNEEDFLGGEYLKQNSDTYFRYLGIKQFLKLTESDSEENINLENIFNLPQIQLSKEEKENIKTDYLQLVRENIDKSHYGKENNVIITIDSQSITSNLYYLEISKEQFYDLIIDILEKIKQDNIILDKIAKQTKSEDLQNDFLNYIDEIIEDIKNKDIKEEMIKISLYEKDGKLLRTAITTNNNNIYIDIHENSMKIENRYNNEEQKHIISINKEENLENLSNIKLNYNLIKDDVIENTITLDIKLTKNDTNINRQIVIGLDNQKNNFKFNILEENKIVNEFKQDIQEIKQNNVIDINTLNANQLEYIRQIIKTDYQEKINKINTLNHIKIIQNILLDEEEIDFGNTEIISETEKNRFNSNFQFFEGEGLTANNIKDLMSYAKTNLKSIKYLKQGNQELQDLNSSLFEGLSSEELKQKIIEIDSFQLNIVKNEKNQEASNNFEKILDIIEDTKFNITIEYLENGLANKINIKIVK